LNRPRSSLALLSLLLLAPGAPAAGEEALPRAEIRVDPAEGTVGERLELTLDLLADRESTVARPEIGSELGPFAARETSWTGPEPVEGGLRWTWQGTVAAFETGSLEVPAISVRVTGPDGDRVVRTVPVPVTIRSVLTGGREDTDLADLKPVASLEPEFGPFLAAALIVLGLLLLSGAGWWLHRRFGDRLSRVEMPADPFQRMPPHVWAYAQLQQLLEKRLGEDGRIDLFYEELSRVLKLYLSGRYRIDLMERTTVEAMPLLSQAGVAREPVFSTRTLLETCDQVKFAGELPDGQARREAVERAYRIVDATKPAEVVEPQEQGKGAA
jgi:hypothetical protein